MRLLTIGVLTAIALASSGAAQTVISVGPFRSVELDGGGHVIVRHGPAQRVTILEGDLQCRRIGVATNQRRVIEHAGRDCRRHERTVIEVVTPEISAISVSNGGTVGSAGTFPVQAAIEAHVEQGGAIDIRSIAADSVDASVHSGGGIFTSPRETLTAAVESGGVITYWGEVRVKRSVRDGGAVVRGKPADAEKPLLDPRPRLHELPPLPPVPPVPPLPDGGGHR
ncbi:MAG TPA: DUF2807 domain-containing protein [Thermoanaerobaculia bacterium]|nr:DUF2807 domain-containing protein [Thermoanaerobaculia bacterium]